MAPKAGSKKSSAKASKTVKVTPEKPLSAKQQKKMEAQKSRHSNRRDLESKAQRILTNKKKLGMTHHDLFCKEVNKKTFAVALMDLIEQKEKVKGNVTDGDLHALKNSFFTADTQGEKALVVAECKEPPRDEFKRLLGLSLMDTNAAKNRVSLYSWLNMVQDVKEQELCGLYNSMLCMNTIASDDNAMHCLKLTALILKRRWHLADNEKYFVQMVHRITNMTMHAAEAAVRAGDTLHDWYTANRSVLMALDCGVTDLDELWTKKANLAEVEQVVARAQTKNGFCNLFFSKEIGAMRWQTWVNTVLSITRKMTIVPYAQIHIQYPGMRAELFDKANEAATKEALEPNVNKDVEVLYGEDKLIVTAKDHVHYAGLATAAFERFSCTGLKEGLPWGFLEKEAARTIPDPELASPLPTHLFAEAKSAKETIVRLIQQSGKKTHHEVLAYLANRHLLLKGKDEFYQLEVARLKVLGETRAFECLKQELLKILPTDESHVSFEEALKQINVLLASDLYAFLGMQQAGEIKAGADLVVACQASDLYHDKAAALQGFEMQVRDGLLGFLKFTKRTPGKLDVKEFYGTAAVKHLMEDLAEPKPAEAVDADRLADAVQFSWALSEVQRDRVLALSNARSVTSAKLAKKAKKSVKSDAGAKTTTNDLAIEMSKNLFSF